MTAFPSLRRVALAGLALLLAPIVLWVATGALAQSGVAAPPGSYQTSCRNIGYSGKTLTADCDMGVKLDGNSRFVHTGAKINTTNCSKSADISNYFGDLVCISILPTDVAPGGSYLQSCKTPHVLDGVMIANCNLGSTGSDKNLTLDLRPCDVSKPVGNISGQLICAPKPDKAPAATPQAQAAPPSGTPTQVKLKAAGCSLFLGRPTEFLCKDDAGFNECKAMINGGDVKTCHAPGQLTTDCQHFLGRADEYLCLSEPAYQQCLSFQAQGKAKACHANGH